MAALTGGYDVAALFQGVESNVRSQVFALQGVLQEYQSTRGKSIAVKNAIKEREKQLESAVRGMGVAQRELDDVIEARHGPFRVDGELMLDVGGRYFSVPRRLLVSDKRSALAGLCASGAPAGLGTPGNPVVIDRDPYSFQFLLAFLESGSLPTDPDELRFLYLDSAHYRLVSCRDAIEGRILDMEREREEMEAAILAEQRVAAAAASVRAAAQSATSSSGSATRPGSDLSALPGLSPLRGGAALLLASANAISRSQAMLSSSSAVSTADALRRVCAEVDLLVPEEREAAERHEGYASRLQGQLMSVANPPESSLQNTSLSDRPVLDIASEWGRDLANDGTIGPGHGVSVRERGGPLPVQQEPPSLPAGITTVELLTGTYKQRYAQPTTNAMPSQASGYSTMGSTRRSAAPTVYPFPSSPSPSSALYGTPRSPGRGGGRLPALETVQAGKDGEDEGGDGSSTSPMALKHAARNAAAAASCLPDPFGFTSKARGSASPARRLPSLPESTRSPSTPRVERGREFRTRPLLAPLSPSATAQTRKEEWEGEAYSPYAGAGAVSTRRGLQPLSLGRDLGSSLQPVPVTPGERYGISEAQLTAMRAVERARAYAPVAQLVEEDAAAFSGAPSEGGGPGVIPGLLPGGSNWSSSLTGSLANIRKTAAESAARLSELASMATAAMDGEAQLPAMNAAEPKAAVAGAVKEGVAGLTATAANSVPEVRPVGSEPVVHAAAAVLDAVGASETEGVIPAPAPVSAVCSTADAGLTEAQATTTITGQAEQAEPPVAAATTDIAPAVTAPVPAVEEKKAFAESAKEAAAGVAKPEAPEAVYVPQDYTASTAQAEVPQPQPGPESEIPAGAAASRGWEW